MSDTSESCCHTMG